MSFSDRFTDSYVVVDLETTGLSPVSDEIIEIAAVKVKNGAVCDKFQTLVDPCRHISYAITSITGIDDRMVKGAPKIGEAMKRFLDFAGDMPLLGHNIVRFDVRFLMMKADITNTCIDTLDIAQHILPEGAGMSLSALCSRYGVVNDNAHRALSDCLATNEVYEALKKEYDRNGAYFNFAAACGKKLHQQNIREKCSVGTVLTYVIEDEKTVRLYADGCEVGTVSGGKMNEIRDNDPIISEVTVAKLSEGAKGKLLMSCRAHMMG